MINQLRTQALEVWGDIHPGLAKPSTLDYLLQSRDHIVIFWFARGNGSRHPVLISKLPRHKLFQLLPGEINPDGRPVKSKTSISSG